MTAPVEGKRYRYVVEGVVTRVIAGGRIVYMLDDAGDRHTFSDDPWGHHLARGRFEPVESEQEAAS